MDAAGTETRPQGHKHSRVQPLQGSSKLICSLCGAVFGRQEHLTRHVRSHSNHKPFSCARCGRSFTRSDTLKRHIAKHRGTGSRDFYPGISVDHLSPDVFTPEAPYSARGDAPSGEGVPASQSPYYNESSNPVPPPSSSISQGDTAGPVSMAVQGCAFSDLISRPASLGSFPSTSEYQAQDMSCTLFEYGGYDLSNLLLMAPFDSPMCLDDSPAMLRHSDGKEAMQTASSLTGQPPSCQEEKSAMVHPDLWSSSRPSSPRGFRIRSCHDTFTPKDAEEATENPRRPAPLQLSREEISNIEDHMHVAPIPGDKMAKLSAFIADQNNPHAVFQDSPVPVQADAEVINRFVQLYFEYFHPILPILHKPTFNKQETPWLLVLAVATVGGHYARERSTSQFVSTLREYLRRAVVMSLESAKSKLLQIWFAQVLLLSHVIMTYSGKKQLVLAALYQRNLLHVLCKGIITGSRTASQHAEEINRKAGVEDWLDLESAARVVYATWLLDCQHSLFLDLPPPSLSPKDLELPLPCAQEIWNTPVEQIDQAPQGAATLHEVLHGLQAGDRFPGVGEFARRIVVTGVYYESRTVLQAAESLHQSGALAHIIAGGGFDGAHLPSAEPMAAAAAPPAVDGIYNSWRRRAVEALACLGPPADCPDGNGDECTLARQQLVHCVSIRLYVPLTRLCALTGWMASEKATAAARRELCAWIRHDGENARRAVMHAAKLFGLVRRQAAGAYFEAHCVLLAALTMWAYALLEPEAVDQEARAHASKALEAAACSSRVVRLDALEDGGESMARWRRYGVALVPHVVGVGSMQGRAGGLRVVGEAQRLLLQRAAWPVSQKFAAVLSDLAVVGRTGNR